MSRIYLLARKIWASLRARPYVSGLILAVVIVGAIAAFQFSSNSSSASTEKGPREVVVKRVSDLMNGSSSLSVVGVVQSRNEAKVSAESGGRITRVNVSLGSNVAAGQILAEIENASQRAALLQAQGFYEAAKAAVPNYTSSLEGARGSALTTLLSTYGVVESAIHDTADPMFSNPDGARPQYNILTSNSQAKIDLENTRPALSGVLSRQKSLSATLSKDSDLKVELSKAESEVREIRNFIDTLIKALSNAQSSPGISDASIAAHKASANAARTALTGTLTAITSARSTLEVAENNVTGSDSVSASGASLKQVDGAYNAARAALDKTIIRAPIAGSVNNFSIKLGDYVSPSQLVAIVSNNGALEIVASIAEHDRTKIQTGDDVTIEGGYKGKITKIAQALDPITHKIEIRIGISSDALKSLTNGQSIRVELIKNTSSSKKVLLFIPIAALKMEADRSMVFTISSDNTLVGVAVDIGELSGETVEITSGLDADTEIVTDARGLKEGDHVAVDNGQ